jgi:hypothetical protein
LGFEEVWEFVAEFSMLHLSRPFKLGSILQCCGVWNVSDWTNVDKGRRRLPE